MVAPRKQPAKKAAAALDNKPGQIRQSPARVFRVIARRKDGATTTHHVAAVSEAEAIAKVKAITTATGDDWEIVGIAG
jgi:hypothetical protein